MTKREVGLVGLTIFITCACVVVLGAVFDTGVVHGRREICHELSLFGDVLNYAALVDAKVCR